MGVVSGLGLRSAKTPRKLATNAPRPPLQEKPENHSLAADSYEPAQGIGLGRFVGTAKRLSAHYLSIGATLGFVVAATALPAVGLAFLSMAAVSGGAAYLTKTPKAIAFKQNPELSQSYHSTLKSQTSEAERRQQFAVIENSLSLPSAHFPKGFGQEMKGSRSASVRELSTGATVLWKTQESGKMLRNQVPRYGENAREEAAYLVDKRLGHYARVPPSLNREIDGEAGLATAIVDKAVPATRDDASDWLMAHPEADGYRRIAIFDNIIGNLDRHDNNYLLTKEGRVVPIDHGLAFPLKNGGHDSLNYNFDKEIVLNDKEKGMLQGFMSQREEIQKELSEHLEPQALSAMFSRVDTMLKTGKTSAAWRRTAEKR